MLPLEPTWPVLLWLLGISLSSKSCAGSRLSPTRPSNGLNAALRMEGISAGIGSAEFPGTRLLADGKEDDEG